MSTNHPGGSDIDPPNLSRAELMDTTEECHRPQLMAGLGSLLGLQKYRGQIATEIESGLSEGDGTDTAICGRLLVHLYRQQHETSEILLKLLEDLAGLSDV